MRIAMMSPTAGLGGGEMMMLTLSTWLRDAGHYVLVLGPDNGDQWLLDEAESRGLPTFRFTRRGPADLSCLRQIVGVCREHRINLIHGHMFASAYYAVAAAKLLRINSYITLHCGGEQTATLRRRVILRWSLRNCTAATAVSAQMKADLVMELGREARRLEVVPNGMPKYVGDRESTRASLGVAADERLVIAVGSCCVRKNHVTLIRALGALPSEIKWKLAISGREDDATSEMQQAIADGALSDRVSLLGIRRDVGNILAAADVYAMPSLWEGMPLALIEAMMAGLPCVASSVGGIPEMITDGLDGILVSPSEIDDWRDALANVLTDRPRALEMGHCAEQRAKTYFGLNAMCEAYQDIYERSRDHRAVPKSA